MTEDQGMTQTPATTGRRFNLISALLAFVIWGSWAYYVSAVLAAGEGRQVVSGLTQGTGSFVITLIMVHAITWLYRRLADHPLRLVLPTLITVSVTGSCLTVAHILVGTDRIAQTIAPGLSVAFAFSLFVTAKLRRSEWCDEPTEDPASE